MKAKDELAEKSERDVKAEQRIVATNAWHLARFVMEHDVEVPETDMGRFMFWCEHYPELNEEDKIAFVNEYAKLEKAAKNVTARTLVATRIHGRGFLHAVFGTSVGQYLVFLSILACSFVYLLIFDPWTTPVPMRAFYAAGLGTCVYLLRITQETLRSREFDPAYIPSHMIRIGLGMLAGGSLVLFPDRSDQMAKSTGLDSVRAHLHSCSAMRWTSSTPFWTTSVVG